MKLPAIVIAVFFAVSLGFARAGESDYEPGLGSAIVSAGRFGFLKGDGLLDCAYPKFGVIEKAHLKEHPLNVAQQAWAVTFGPTDRTVKPKESFRVNWTTVVWESEFGTSAKWRVTYSIASPGILIETDDNTIRFGLDSTPGYGQLALPLARGVTTRKIADGYEAERDGRLAENWMLLCGSGAFPDAPLLLVLKENPVSIIPELADGKLKALTLRFAKPAGHIIVATPYGLEGFSPGQVRVDDAARRCRFWSKALLAFVIGCKESFKVDPAAGTVSIAQDFEYRRLNDAWNSQPVTIAPYPPALATAAKSCRDIRLASETKDLEFPTKYGPLHGIVGSSRATYTLPIPPTTARIPLAPAGDSVAKREIRERHRIAPHDGAKPLPPDLFPGFWSRRSRNAVDAASMAGERAFIWPWLNDASRTALKQNLRTHVADCLDDQACFAQTALARSIEKTPADAGKLTRPIWFDRTEPFTHKRYALSYTIPDVRAKGESITDCPRTFTDLEWGNGLSLHGLYEMARLSGAWDVVRRNWPLVKRIYGLFEALQDWACMSVSGSENGRRWTDTSSYGGYLAFAEMARHVGDEAAWREGVYLHAKHAAMRLAMFNNGAFIHRFYAAKPWKVQHSFPEMARDFNTTFEPVRFGGPLKFTPDELRGDDLVIQRVSLYSLVAEGTGWECPDMLFTMQPEPTSEFVRLYDKLYPEWRTAEFCKAMNDKHSPSGGITLYEMMLFELRDSAVNTATVRRHFEEIRQGDLIRRFLKGFYGRWNAAHEYTAALAETRDDPAWLEDWIGADIISAEYDRDARRAVLKLTAPGKCSLQLGGAEPKRVTFNGQSLARPTGWSFARGRLSISLPSGGVVEVGY